MFKKGGCNRILILSPHTDDGELSSGGTIAKFIEMGKEIYYIALSTCKKSVPDCYDKTILMRECKSALNELDVPQKNIFIFDYEVREFEKYRQEILDQLIQMSNEIQPDLVICPSSFDIHQDHRVIHNECLRAFKKNASIWGMEHPWNNLSFRTDIFIDLEQKHLQKKINALDKYRSQSSREYFTEDFIKAWAHTRGMNIGIMFAEVFECIRIRI
jgi:LmbE family N-acetylglucosaminyl deacetylase